MARSIKKVPVEQLRPGMFVHDIGVGSLDHPFESNRFRITCQEEVDRIRALRLRFVFIDTARGLDTHDAWIR